MAMLKRKVNCMFYKPKDDDPLINRIVAYWKGPFSHVELSFEDGVASSIFRGETVFFNPKNYSNPNYTVLSIAIGDKEYERIRGFCEDAHKKTVAFSMVGMIMSLLPWQLLPTSEKHTFCSRFVTEALQAGNVSLVRDLNPSLTSPSRLHEVLSKDESKVLDTVPGRLRLKWTV